MNVLWRHARKACSTSFHNSPTSPFQSPQLNRVDKHIQLLGQHSQNPLWELLAALNGRSAQLPAALTKCNISDEEYNYWKPILVHPDMNSALEALRNEGIIDRREPLGTVFQNLPSWVALFLTSFKTRSYRQAYAISRALQPAQSVSTYQDGLTVDSTHPKPVPYSSVECFTTPQTSHNHQAHVALLIFNTLHLARHNLLVPLRQNLRILLSPEYQISALQCNIILQALSMAPSSSAEIETRIISVFNTMRYRGMDVESYSLHRVLNGGVAGPTLVKYIGEQMSRETIRPHLVNKEALLRASSKLAAAGRLPIKRVQQYHQMIEGSIVPSISNETPPNTEPPSEPEVEFSEGTTPYMAHTLNRANMRYVMAHTKRKDAFRLFNDLLNRAPQRSSDFRPDIYSYTAALTIAARDITVPARDLVKAFRQLPRTLRPTPTIYHVVIRGLFERKSKLAVKLWDQFCVSGLPIDKYILSLGLRILTRESKPQSAFALLERFTRKGHDPMTAAPLQVSAVTVNDYLVGLCRIGRPDMVFFLFENMSTLFHTLPDCRSLSILLYGARIARRLDNSLAGVVAELSLKNPFRSSQHASHTSQFPTRDEVILAVAGIIGTPETGIKPYKPRIWHDQTAVHRTITIFQQVMFGNDPELLRHVRPPAYALRASADEDPAAGFGGLLPKFGKPIDPTMDVKTLDALLNEDGTTKYPSIVVTNENVIGGVILLGLSSRTPEIPLMLAWMKALKIQPSPSTFAVALTFWEEVSFEAPLMEKLSGENTQYMKLWNWMKDWVGEDRMPDGRLMRVWEENVRKMRS